MDLLTREQAKSFIWTLFNPDDRVEYRLIGDGEPIRGFFRASDVEKRLDLFSERNARGYNVYVGLSARTKAKGDASAIGDPRVIFADLDGVPVSVAVSVVQQEALPTPTIVSSSGHGTHLFWMLEEAIPGERWTRIQKAVADRLGGDPKVCDLPRVVRLPGFLNVKGDPVPCEIVDIDSDRVWSADEFPEQEIRLFERSASSASSGELLSATTLFLAHGAREGSRNHRAFAAACDLLASGWPAEKMRAEILRAGTSCGLSPQECDRIASSAMSRKREKQDDEYSLPKEVDQWLDSLLIFRADEIRPATAKEASSRVVCNFVLEQAVNSAGEVIVIRRPLDMRSCAAAIIANDMLYATSGLLFHEDEQIRSFESVEKTFGHLHQVAEVDWFGGASKNPRRDGKRQAYITKGEFHAALPSIVKQFDSIEHAPHVPPVKSAYYSKRSMVRKCETTRVQDFVDLLTPKEDEDRALILSMLLTGIWGGPCGARPLFVIGSRDGRGSGKTTLAECVADLFGGAIRVSDTDNAESVSKKMVSESGMTARVVIFDNQKKQMGGQYIESSITSPRLEGHRLYFGRMDRPNRLVWIATSNSFSLSHDMAQRSVPIFLTKPDYRKPSPTKFVEDHRDEILGGLISMMDRPPASSPAGFRWPRWASEVLGRVCDPAPVIDTMMGRRSDSDDDADLACQLAESIDEALALTFPSMPILSMSFNLSLKVVRDIMVKAELVKPGDTVQVAMRKLGEVSDLEPLKSRLSRLSGRGTKGRRMRWLGPNYDGQSEPYDVESVE